MLIASLLPAGLVKAQAEEVRNDKLAFLPRTAPALVGHLGEPEMGSPLEIQDLRMVWHPAGRLLISNNHPGARPENLTQVWNPSTATQPAKYKGTLNTGGIWSVSTNGDMLCGEPYVEGQSTPENAVSCYRFADARRLWKFVLDKDEQTGVTCFSRDDKKILLVTKQGAFCRMRLVDVETGKEESRAALAESNLNQFSSEGIVSTQDGFVLLLRYGHGDSKLVEVKTNPLRVESGAFEGLELGNIQRLIMSRDDRYLAISGHHEYQVAELRNGKWELVLDGRARNAMYNTSLLKAAIFSPDSRLLFLGSGHTTKVIDLPSKKLVKEANTSCKAAVFSPDGSQVLVGEHSGLGTWNTRDWTYRASLETQHECPVISVKFLPDNRTLVSQDHNGFIVWDVGSRKIRAALKGQRPGSQFGSYAFAEGMGEIIAADGWDYLRWKLPDVQGPVPERPEQIIGVTAFGDMANQAESCEQQDIYGDSAGRRFLTVTQEGTYLRDLGSIQMLKTLNSLKGIRFGPGAHLAFLEDQKVCLHDYDGQLHHLDLVSDRLTPVEGKNHELVRWGRWLPGRQCYLTGKSKEVCFIDAHNGMIQAKLIAPKGSDSFGRINGGEFVAAVSRDEKMAALYMKSVFPPRRSVSFWDIDTGKLLATQQMPGTDVACLDFSTDGKMLAVGHGNTAISLWNVETILKGEVPEAVAKTDARGTRQRSKIEVVSGEVPEGQPDAEGHLWSFLPDGSCAIQGRLPSFGGLQVNGKAFVSKSAHHLKKEGPVRMASPFYTGHEGEIPGEMLWVNRRLGFHKMDLGSEPVLHAVDGLTNIGDRPVQAEITFEVKFPADSQGLLRAAEERLKIPGDGRFALGKDDHWLAAAGTGKRGETVAAVRMQGWSRGLSPEMEWDESDQRLRATYRVEIPPGETRWLAHGVGLVKRFAEGSIDAIAPFPEHADIGHYVPPGNHHQAINFSRPDLWNPDHRKGPPPSAMSWSSEGPKPKPEMDGLGFSWERQHDLGRLGELGATSLFQVWFDGHPASSGSFQPLLRSNVGGKVVLPAYALFAERDLKVSVVRRDQPMAGGAATVWHDRYYNGSEVSQKVRVSYVTTFRSPVLEVWDKGGNKYSAQEVKGGGAAFGGACAFVLEGQQQPATLLAFQGEGAALAPSIRWLGPTAVVLDYEFDVESKASVSLLHGACQRPLKAFGGAVAAFADWLPLTFSVASPKPVEGTPVRTQPPSPILNHLIQGNP